MNKKFLALTGLSIALIIGVVSCVSAQKNTTDRGVASIATSISEIFEVNEKNSMKFNTQSPAKALTSDEIRGLATSSNLKLEAGELIIDNDVAFDTKLSLIQNAQNEIRMVYYIYSDDDSASVITRELIKKAKSGVKVKLLVDIITNYSKMDLFSTMVKEGMGNIDIRFYNFPPERILADAKYMTLPCPKLEKPDADSCSKFKANLMNSLSAQETTFFSKVMLSGLYAKNTTALKVALGVGGQINPADYKKKEGQEEQNIGQLFDFFKLLVDAKINHNIGAYIKLSIAMAMYADELNPVMNELTGRLPVINNTVIPGSKTSHSQEWDHFTDYVHHKLLVVDGHEFQLGGRNIEDSYHMKSRLGTKGKYIFMDTDFHGKTAAGGAAEIEKSFDAMFNFSDMVASLDKVQRIMPYDIVANPQALGFAALSCSADAQSGKIQPETVGACVEQRFAKSSLFKSQSVRQVKVLNEMNISAQNYLTNYQGTAKKQLRDNWKMQTPYSPSADNLSTADLQTSEIYYVENTPYNVKSSNKVRLTGSYIGAEEMFNKNIHALWYKGLENACKASQVDGAEKRVILHTAYLFMPSGMVHRIAKMLNGDFGDCSKVRVTFLTNSFQTTDLNVINIFSRYQMIQLFKHYSELVAYDQKLQNQGETKLKRWFPKLEYFEYNASSVGSGISLHTKLSLLGDDMIIGSANADARSYHMDTNNGVFIRNAHELNRDYTKFVDYIIDPKNNKTTEWTQTFASYTEEKVQAENNMILNAMLKRWDKKGRVNDAKKKEILATISRLGLRVTDVTRKMLSFRGEFDNRFFMGATQNDAGIEIDLNKSANEFDDLFKVL